MFGNGSSAFDHFFCDDQYRVSVVCSVAGGHFKIEKMLSWDRNMFLIFGVSSNAD